MCADTSTALIVWFGTLDFIEPQPRQLEDLADPAILLHLFQYVLPSHFSDLVPPVSANWILRLTFYRRIIERLSDVLRQSGQHCDLSEVDLNALTKDSDPQEAARLAEISLAVCVLSPKKNEIVSRILALEDAIQEKLMDVIQHALSSQRTDTTALPEEPQSPGSPGALSPVTAARPSFASDLKIGQLQQEIDRLTTEKLDLQSQLQKWISAAKTISTTEDEVDLLRLTISRLEGELEQAFEQRDRAIEREKRAEDRVDQLSQMLRDMFHNISASPLLDSTKGLLETGYGDDPLSVDDGFGQAQEMAMAASRELALAKQRIERLQQIEANLTEELQRSRDLQHHTLSELEQARLELRSLKVDGVSVTHQLTEAHARTQRSEQAVEQATARAEEAEEQTMLLAKRCSNLHDELTRVSSELEEVRDTQQNQTDPHEVLELRDQIETHQKTLKKYKQKSTEYHRAAERYFLEGQKLESINHELRSKLENAIHQLKILRETEQTRSAEAPLNFVLQREIERTRTENQRLRDQLEWAAEQQEKEENFFFAALRHVAETQILPSLSSQ